MNSKTILLTLTLLMGTSGVYAANNTWAQELQAIEANLLAHPHDLPTLVKGVVAYNNYAQMLMKQKNYQQAVEYFKKALAIAPEQNYIKKNISDAYLAWAKDISNDNLPKAGMLSKMALEYNVDNLEAYKLNKFADSSFTTANEIDTNPAPTATAHTLAASQPLDKRPQNNVNPSTMPTVPSGVKVSSNAADPNPNIKAPPPTPISASGIETQINDLLKSHGATSTPTPEELNTFFKNSAAVPTVDQINNFMRKYGADKPATANEMYEFAKQYVPQVYVGNNLNKP